MARGTAVCARLRRVAGAWPPGADRPVHLVARGRFALTEPTGRLRDWPPTALRAGAARVAATSAPPPRLL